MDLEKEDISTTQHDEETGDKTFEIRDLPTTTIVTPMEEHLDFKNCFELRKKVKSIISKGRAKIAIDLKYVQYIDSGGLGTLFSCFKAAREEGGDLKLFSPQPTVMECLEITRMDRIFDIYESETEALVGFTE